MKINYLLYSVGSVFFFAHIANADYAATVNEPNYGYQIILQGNNSKLSGPFRGSDGNQYYRIGSPIDVRANSPGVSVSGTVSCGGRLWNGGRVSDRLPAYNARHRVFAYLPQGPSIDNVSGFVLNENLVVTLDSRYLNTWGWNTGPLCSSDNPFTWNENVAGFSVQFPIVFTFYLNSKIIDNQIPIPAMDLAGYVRAFTISGRPPYTSWPIGQTTAPIRLSSSVVNVESSCNTMTSTGQANILNLRHGHLNSLNYDSYVSEKVTYTCKFTQSTPVRLRLSYTTDNDSGKRLPMMNSANDKIYSELVLIDDTTGQSGKDMKINIHESKTITVQSHIKGSNANGGDYNGSAWLIATFD